MSRFLKLLNFEYHRFSKVYLVLLSITILSQIVGVYVLSRNYLKRMQEVVYEYGHSINDFIQSHGTMNMIKITHSIWFIGPIALCVISLLIYLFIIWYRESYGRSTFIKRLFIMSMPRMNIFFTKLISILIMVFGLIALQILLLYVSSELLTWIVPNDFRTDYTISEIIRHTELKIFIPESFTELILIYGIGLMFVVVLFTIILFERSFQLRGILIGTVYGAVTVVVFTLPMMAQTILNKKLFHNSDLVSLEVLLGLIIVISSLFVSRYLLNHKVTV